MALRYGVYFGMMVVLMSCYEASGADDDNSDSCASSLAPCAPYLNDTKPPKSCCDPLLTVIKTQQKCLCDLLGSVNSLGINVTQALELPGKCGKNVTTAACKSESGGTNSTTPPAGRPSSSSSSSSPSSNNDNTKNGSDSVPKFQFSGIVGLMSLLVLVLGMLRLQP